MKTAFFITGTDTDVGKTFACLLLLRQYQRQNQSALGMKPIAAGQDAAGNNEDCQQLIAASSINVTVGDINTYLFAPAIAPHIAARQNNVKIDFHRIRQQFLTLKQRADVVLVEGVGGFRVPLGENENGQMQDTADLAQYLNLPIILVVGMRLGCLSHALLSVEAIAGRGLELAAWIANSIEHSMPAFDENIDSLKCAIHAPLLGIIPHGAGNDTTTDYLQLSYLQRFLR